MTELTQRQQALLRAIEEWTAELGFPPTHREVRERAGVNSAKMARQEMEFLRDLGLVTWRDGEGRSIALTHGGRKRPFRHRGYRWAREAASA